MQPNLIDKLVCVCVQLWSNGETERDSERKKKLMFITESSGAEGGSVESS